MKKYILVMLMLFSSLINAAYADVMVGDITHSSLVTNSCYPFGCATGDGSYTEKYYYSNFDNQLNISKLSFNTVDSPNGIPSHDVSSGFFTVTMSWSDVYGTAGPKNSLSHSEVVYQGDLSKISGFGDFIIPFDKTYFYSPTAWGANGGIDYYDLVMNVKWTGAAQTGNPIMIVNGTGMYSELTINNNLMFQHNYGPYTKLTVVPEPDSLALMAFGLFGLGAMQRRRFNKK